MVTLRTPLLRKSFLSHTLTVESVQVGAFGRKVRKDGKSWNVLLVAVQDVSSHVMGIDQSKAVDGCETGIYSDGKSWYQISFRRL